MIKCGEPVTSYSHLTRFGQLLCSPFGRVERNILRLSPPLGSLSLSRVAQLARIREDEREEKRTQDAAGGFRVLCVYASLVCAYEDRAVVSSHVTADPRRVCDRFC